MNGNKPGKPEERYILRPVEGAEWELWSVTPGQDARCIKRTEGVSALKEGAIMGVPSQYFYSVTHWLNTVDPEVLPEMVSLQLERRGLYNRSNPQSVSEFRVISAEETQTLAFTTVLPSNIPDEVCQEKIDHFEPSARLYPLPENQVTIWREGERLVAAVTRVDQLVYFQALSDSVLSPLVVQDLRCMWLQLETQHAIVGLAGVTLWGDFTEEQAEMVSQAFMLPVTVEPRPAPAIPFDSSSLVPLKVQTMQAESAKRRKLRNVALAFGAVYVTLFLAFAGYVGWLAFSANRIKGKMQADAPTVDAIQKTASRWEALEYAINPEYFVVEQLFQTSQVLPTDGVRFTLFEVQNGMITIQGEASSPPSAFNFSEALKQSNALSMYTWEMQNPSVGANNITNFVITGRPINAQSNQ